MLSFRTLGLQTEEHVRNGCTFTPYPAPPRAGAGKCNGGSACPGRASRRRLWTALGSARCRFINPGPARRPLRNEGFHGPTRQASNVLSQGCGRTGKRCQRRTPPKSSRSLIHNCRSVTDCRYAVVTCIRASGSLGRRGRLVRNLKIPARAFCRGGHLPFTQSSLSSSSSVGMSV